MSWDFSTEPEFEKKLEWMREFVRDEVYPLEVLEADERGFMRVIRSLQDEVKRQHLWATHLPPELGGQGYGQVKLGLMHEIEGATVWAPIVFGNQAPDSGNSEVLAHFGTQAQKDRWLYPLLDGRLRSAFSMTEPFTAGSDPTLLSSTARLEGDEWVINGHKWLPAANLLGKRGQGFLIAQARLGPGRIHHCMRWLGMARRAFDMMCERALQREAFGKKLASHETVQNWIADSAAEMSAARLMTLHAAWVIDTQGAASARKEISMIKFFGARVLHDVIDRALQIHGSLGYSADLPLEDMYRIARAARFYDGPDEVHRVSVARQVLSGYKEPPGKWPREHVPTRREAARRKFAALLEAATTDV